MPTTSPTPPEATPAEPGRLPLIALVGRPNVGKSALFNRIIGRRLAIVHEQCGVTRDRHIAQGEWDNKAFELVDTGGLTEFGGPGADTTIEAETRRQAELALDTAAFVIFVVDAESGPASLDEDVDRLLHRRGVPVVLAANK